MEDKDVEEVLPEAPIQASEEESSFRSDVGTVEDDDDIKEIVEASSLSAPKTDYQEALKDLNTIALSGKRILEEDSGGSSSKRLCRSVGNDKEDENVKLESPPHGLPPPDVSVKDLEVLKREFKRLSRSELENLVLQKMVAFLFCESEIGALRQKCDYFDEMNERGKKKVQALQKQCQDLNTVMQRYIKDVSNSGPKERVTPVRVTRSVGLQVRLPPSSSSSSVGISSAASPLTSRLNEASPKGTTLYAGGSHSIKKIASNASLTVLPVSEGGRTAHSPAVSKKPGNSSKGVIDLVDLSDEEEDEDKAHKKSTPTAVMHQRTASNSTAVIGRASLLPLSSRTPPHAAAAAASSSLATHRMSRLGRLTMAPKPGHPAPLPSSSLGPINPNWKWPPPKPSLKISKLRTGIVLSWNLDLKMEHAPVLSYQLFAYKETSSSPSSSLWKKVGDVKALPLPMACTLTQFMKGNKYHFAIRAMDSHNRPGPFSDPSSILLT